VQRRHHARADSPWSSPAAWLFEQTAKAWCAQQKVANQKIRDALIADYLVRLEIAKAAIEVHVAPTGLSFLRALHIIQHELIWAAGMSPGKLPAHLARLCLKLQTAVVEKRRGRKCPRVVKAKPARYPARHLKEL